MEKKKLLRRFGFLNMEKPSGEIPQNLASQGTKDIEQTEEGLVGDMTLEIKMTGLAKKDFEFAKYGVLKEVEKIDETDAQNGDPMISQDPPIRLMLKHLENTRTSQSVVLKRPLESICFGDDVIVTKKDILRNVAESRIYEKALVDIASISLRETPMNNDSLALPSPLRLMVQGSRFQRVLSCVIIYEEPERVMLTEANYQDLERKDHEVTRLSDDGAFTSWADSLLKKAA